MSEKVIFKDLLAITNELYQKGKQITIAETKFWYYQCKELFSNYLKNEIPWMILDENADAFTYGGDYAFALVKAGKPFVEMAYNYVLERKIVEKRKYSKLKIFIVHGSNIDLRDKIEVFINRELKIETIVMEAGPNSGRTLPEKFEEMATETNIAIFIYSADDKLILVDSQKNVKRARQNVLIETGYFWGALGRVGKIIFLVDDDPELELPSDILGIGWIRITKDLGETKLRLQKEILNFVESSK